MNTTTQKTYDLSNLFVFDDYEGDIQKTFLEEVGTLVFQSALMRYLAEHTDSEGDTFENFIQSHVASETFVEELCGGYPEFEELLNAEMQSFCHEVKN
jgi:hypothetical protein